MKSFELCYCGTGFKEALFDTTVWAAAETSHNKQQQHNSRFSTRKTSLKLNYRNDCFNVDCTLFNGCIVKYETLHTTNSSELFQTFGVINCFDLPKGIPVSRQVAAKAPAEAPEIFCKSNCGAYFLKHTATPTIERWRKSRVQLKSVIVQSHSNLTMINSQKSATRKWKIVL